MGAWSEIRRDVRFAAGLAARRPFQVLLQITNRCNMRCSFCDFWANGAPPADELTLDDYRALEEQMASIGAFLVSIEGGEPFLRPDLIDIIRLFARRHVPVLYTNGWYVDAAAARALFDAGLTQVGVSIDFPESARHDAKRGPVGAFASAVRAAELLRDAAPHGGRQVHLMTVLMRDNQHDLEELLALSGRLGVGHALTLLSREGYRRGEDDLWPDVPLNARLEALWKRHPHFRVFRDYLARVDTFLGDRQSMPACHAGEQTFNVDHLGNVAACIEKIDRIAGNVRREPLAAILERMRGRAEAAGCQDCWTLCRGFGQTMGGGGSLSGWTDLVTRMRA